MPKSKIYKRQIKKIVQKNKNYRINKTMSQERFVSSDERMSDYKSPQNRSRTPNRSYDSPSPYFRINKNDEIPDWDHLTFGDKARLFSSWVLLIIFANFMIVIGSVFMIFNTKEAHSKGEAMLGIGGFAIWLSLIKYYENSRGYNIVVSTFQNAGQVVLMAFIGVLPIFIGFALLGMSFFWRSKRFFGLGPSLYSLFAIMNGDMIFDSYNDLDTIDYIMSQIFLYTFILTSILVIQNVFISIIADGYMISKFKHRNDWLKHVHNDEMEDVYIDQRDSSYAKYSPTTNIQNKTPKKGKRAEVTDDNPFAKFKKQKKKEIKSRDALVKMLWDEKLQNRYTHSNVSDDRQYSQDFGRSEDFASYADASSQNMRENLVNDFSRERAVTAVRKNNNDIVFQYDQDPDKSQ